MKRLVTVFLLCFLTLPLLFSCKEDKNDGAEGSSSEGTASGNVTSEDASGSENAKIVWDQKYAGGEIKSADDVKKTTVYSDGKIIGKYDRTPKGDTRYMFEGAEETRVANLSEGYALTLPGKDIKADFSLGKLRSKYITDDYVLTLTYENQNPYGNTAEGFKIYYDEWLARYLENIDFLLANSIRRTRPIGVTETLLEGYTVNYFDMNLSRYKKEKMAAYSIAIVRPTGSYDYFWFFVMKSKKPMYEQMDKIVASFSEFAPVTEAKNDFDSYELKIPKEWDDETKAYFEKIQNQQTVDFGMFYESNSQSYIDWMKSDEALGTSPDVFMTYQHLGWGDKREDINLEFIKKNAGGNGFNGLPVLELTYQFTNSNNAMGGYTPMYDICRGHFDSHFRKLAKDLKEYGHPVLFRLNNEMNTDWTSYCGMATLCDPDIFIETWRRLYDIFREEGVTNCIWIFNPIATSCPYSNWGDMLNYFPGEDYVQMLGLTYYQMNTADYVASFKELYQELYKKNTPYFDNYPAIIGEFGCAAGGDYVYDWEKLTHIKVPEEEIENRKKLQAGWISGMADCFLNNQDSGNVFCKNIKIATWFSANDYVDIDGEFKILNKLKLGKDTPLAIEQLRKWLETKNNQK